ncbi:hypothetical protein L1049_007525 [Liquidambar formosana]|uniref:Uncharacterized protein n=1 Tax=Liquidambar formosana TaxID=63359 RepID=A0AAP0S8B9_LIQFO
MEEGKIEQEVDELNNLLDEIPNATCGNPHPDSSNLTDCLENSEWITLEEKEKRSSPPAAFTNFYHTTQATSPSSNAALSLGKHSNTFANSSQRSPNGNFHTCGSSVGWKEGIENGHQTPIKINEPEESRLPDEQSLASAIAELSFKDGMTVEAENFWRVNNKRIPNHTILLEEQFTYCFKKSLYPSLHSPNSMHYMSAINLPSNGHDRFNVGMNEQERIDFLKLDDQIKMQKDVSFQPLGHQTYHSWIPSSVPSPVIEVPVGLYEKQSSPSLQSLPPQMQSKGLSQSHIPWLNIEEEQYFRMHHKYLHLQQLQNQHSQSPNRIYASANVTTRPGTWNMNEPFSNQYERLYEELFQKNNALPRGFNCSGPTSMSSILCRYYAQGFCGRGESCPFAHGQKKISPSSLDHPQPALSAKDFDAIQDLSKVGKQNFPVRISTRKKSTNSVKAGKFNSVGEIESPKTFSSNVSVSSNGHLHHNAPILSAGLFQLDGRNVRCQSPDTKDGRHNNVVLQPQKFNSVDEVAGKIYITAKDQYGCRSLQRKLSEGNAEDVEKILIEIVDHVVELMTHPFGNYLVQKLLEVCNEDQRTQIVYVITEKYGDLVRISCNMHGTRAVQKVIETIRTPEQFSMVVTSLKPGIVNMIKDINGNHVAKRCLQCLMPRYIEFLFEAVTGHCVELATDRHGCCVLQKCLSYSDGEQRHHLMCEIISNALTLSQDPFGNYLVQYVFDLKLSWATAEVLNQLEGNYGYLSMQKYSSNVIEQCLSNAGEEQLSRIIEELINNSQLDQIMQDVYGNYVIQTALNHSKGPLHAALVEAIRPHISTLRISPYGKKVLSCINVKK